MIASLDWTIGDGGLQELPKAATVIYRIEWFMALKKSPALREDNYII